MGDKQRISRVSTTGLRSLPGFEDSLRLLVERERYALTDIALMFGVTREYVRQLCERIGLVHPDGGKVGLHCSRIWNDEAHCFQPVSKGDMAEKRRRALVAANRAAFAARLQARRERLVTAVADLRVRLGREPFWDEIALALGWHGVGQSVPWVVGHWGGHMGGDHGSAWVLREIRKATGLAPLPSGHHSHRRYRPGSAPSTRGTANG